ncbi:MAG: tRNA (5-methylaminomethyl-2-thiouridylate)-methyltransferase [Gammaproteobacteria bacterium]
MTTQRKAVALISGGLDSMLAARTIMDQGIHVEGINFFTGFCVEGHTHAIRHKDRAKPKRNNALWVAEQLGIKLHIIDVVEEYKDVVINPKHGYGANLNPCLDCKGFMVRHAYHWVEENAFDFIITGEVIGQRPMSQRRDTLPVVARDSGAGDRLLRPLCANTQKLQDLWRTRGDKRYELDDIMLLKIGRHLRPRPHFKLVVGREEGENNFLEGYRHRFTHLRPLSHKGPLVLVDGTAGADDLRLAAQLAARFSQGRDAPTVEVAVTEKDGQTYQLTVPPLSHAEIPQEWYL